MAGLFELFTDFRSRVRFRLLAPDGTVLAISEAYGDKRAAVAAITDVRECAGTGLIQDHCAGSTRTPRGSLRRQQKNHGPATRDTPQVTRHGRSDAAGTRHIAGTSAGLQVPITPMSRV